jgi:NhaC family Na+:H+ antiporter
MLDLLLLILSLWVGAHLRRESAARGHGRARRVLCALTPALGALLGRAGGLALALSPEPVSLSVGLAGFGAPHSGMPQVVSVSAALLGLNLLGWLSSGAGKGGAEAVGARALLSATLPLSALMCFLCLNVACFGDSALSGPNQIALLTAAALAIALGAREGVSVQEALGGVRRAVSDTLEPLLILLLIGALSGTWLLSGVVPALIDYGLALLAPSYFLVAACALCSLVSLASGSSWSTVATVGVALMGVGQTLGLSPALCAGAIISGAYFGDKMSPISDTTNLAPAMAGGELFAHIRAMIHTTLPTFTLTLLAFIALGLNASSAVDLSRISEVRAALRAAVWIHPSLFIVPALVAWMISRRLPTLPTLAAGAVFGGIVALWAQPELVARVGGGEGGRAAFTGVMRALSHKVELGSSDPMVAELLTSKGMEGMLGTVWLILCALVFGGVMERVGALERISGALMRLARTDRDLVLTTGATSIFLNATASDQYLAIVVPGRMYRDVYRARGLAPEALSRTLEDCATVTSVLVPWNTCGAMQASVLGVATLAYAPFCVFCWLSPLMTALFAVMGWRQPRRVDILNAAPDR